MLPPIFSQRAREDHTTLAWLASRHHFAQVGASRWATDRFKARPAGVGGRESRPGRVGVGRPGRSRVTMSKIPSRVAGTLVLAELELWYVTKI